MTSPMYRTTLNKVCDILHSFARKIYNYRVRLKYSSMLWLKKVFFFVDSSHMRQVLYFHRWVEISDELFHVLVMRITSFKPIFM